MQPYGTVDEPVLQREKIMLVPALRRCKAQWFQPRRSLRLTLPARAWPELGCRSLKAFSFDTAEGSLALP